MLFLWLKAFALTVLVEEAVAVPLLHAAEPRGWRRAAVVFFANLASHPAVWFVFPLLGLSYPSMLWLAEAWAVVIEAIFYAVVFAGAPKRRLLGVALLANGASWTIGNVVRGATPWLG